MLEKPYTLYKLIVLYMLQKVNFPMTNAQISDFFLAHNYTQYFHLQQVLSEMIDSHLIHTEQQNHTTYYYVDDQGKQTLAYFETEISPEIRRDISNYLVLHSYEMRNDSSSKADYFRSSDHDYTVHCQVQEGNSRLIEIKLSAPTEKAAQTLCDNWKKKSQEVYEQIMQTLA